MTEFYVQVIVHGTLPAASAREALDLLCARVREGIGEEGEGREWDVAIAAGRAGGQMLVNEEFLRRTVDR